jgi:tripartite-type tricarboxylate transporter receptor subunit TctC
MRLPDLLVLTVTAILAAVPQTIHAQTYPTQPIRILVAFPPGGGVDLSTRSVATKLTEALGKPVVVENRPGAAGQVAIQAVLAAPADGYTLLSTSNSPIVIGPHLDKLAYNPVTDLTPVTITAYGMLAVAVNAASPIRSMSDLIAVSKQTQGGLSFSNPGVGTQMHLAGELLKSLTGANLVAIPYQGTAPAALAVVSGEVPVAISDLTSLKAQADAGKVRMLAIANSRRSLALPDVPTVAEAGVPGYAADAWAGLFARAGTPQDIVDRLNAEVVKAVALPEVRDVLLRGGLEPTQMSTAQARQFVVEDSKKWGDVIAKANIKIN